MLKKEDSKKLTPEIMIEEMKQSGMFPQEVMDLFIPLITPFLPDIAKEINLVEAHAKAHIEAKLAENPDLNREEEEAKMKVRKHQKMVERMQPIYTKIFASMMQTQFDPSMVAAIELDELPTFRELSQQGFIQQYPERQRNHVEARLADPSTAQSKFFEWGTKKISNLGKSSFVDQSREIIQQNGAEAYIMQFILRHLRVLSIREEVSENTTQRLEALFQDRGSHAYAALQAEVIKLNTLFEGEVSFEALDCFRADVPFNIHKALEKDAPDIFVEKVESQADNRYFTRWSEQGRDGGNDCGHQRGFFN